MSLTDAEKNRLKKAGLKGLNKPKKTPSHPTKKGVVAVRDKGKVKIIRFGDQKMGHNYSAEARKASKLDMLRTSRKAKHLRLIGQTKFFGLVKVVARKAHPSHKNKSSVEVNGY